MAEETKLSGLEKAAVLFKVLGPNLARPLFRSLSETDIMKIRSQMNELPGRRSSAHWSNLS